MSWTIRAWDEKGRSNKLLLMSGNVWAADGVMDWKTSTGGQLNASCQGKSHRKKGWPFWRLTSSDRHRQHGNICFLDEQSLKWVKSQRSNADIQQDSCWNCRVKTIWALRWFFKVSVKELQKRQWSSIDWIDEETALCWRRRAQSQRIRSYFCSRTVKDFSEIPEIQG